MKDTQATMEAALGRRIRELREARGWSQREVAEHMKRRGFDWIQTTVAKSEAADRPIRVNEAAALARVFEESVEALIFEQSKRGNLIHSLNVAEDSLELARANLAQAEEEVQRRRVAVDSAEAARDRAEREVDKHGKH